MTDIQAALGLSQLQRLDQIVKERRELLNEYERMMTDLPLRMLEVGIDVQTAGHLAIIRLDNTCPEHHRAIFSGLRALQIGVQVHYTPVHLQPYYRNLGFRESDFPAAEAYATNAISLPIYPGLLKEHQERVVSCLSALLCNGSIRLRG
jgi:dTDP-4-amino-4,6-dideoxygalactose transaminase